MAPHKGREAQPCWRQGVEIPTLLAKACHHGMDECLSWWLNGPMR